MATRKAISKDVSHSLGNAIHLDCVESPDQNPTDFASKLSKILNYYAPDIVREIADACENDCSAIHITDFVPETIAPKTPYDGKVDFEKTKRAVANIYSVIGIMGLKAILYPVEETTTLRVVSARYNSDLEKSSQSPHSNLPWHVDMAYRPFNSSEDGLSPMPHYLIFGVVATGNTYLPITYISMERLVELLDPQDLQVALAAEFELSSPDSVSNAVVRKKLPLLVKDAKGGYYNRINMQKTRPLTARAETLLGKLAKITADKSITEYIDFEAGDVIALNNKNTVHTRAFYSPTWDGHDRYLIRVYAVRDLDAGISLNPDRRWEWI